MLFMRGSSVRFASLILLVLLSGATGTARQPSPVAPQLQRAIALFEGTWTISETYPASPDYPAGAAGTGTATWRRGPDGKSLFHEYHAAIGGKSVDGYGAFWWDAKENRIREVWCMTGLPDGCTVSTTDIRWRGSDLVLTESYENNGQQRRTEEIFSDISATSYRQTIKDGLATGELKPYLVAKATRQK